MLKHRVIPCLDVRDGRIVKGVRFSNLRDAGDPAERAAAYEQAGADEIVILDVSATAAERAHAVETVARVRAVLSIPLTVGGGVRTVEDGLRLLEAGADRVGINSAAVANPSLLNSLAERVGRQCVVIAVDAARREGCDGWEVVTIAGTHRTGLDAIDWMRDAEDRGAGEVLLTSWDEDGRGQGYDLPLLRAARKAINIPIIASGGAAGPEHMAEALDAGADAVLAASIFHDNIFSVQQVKETLRALGEEVRL